LQLGELQYLLFIDYELPSAVKPYIWHSVVLHCREKAG